MENSFIFFINIMLLEKSRKIMSYFTQSKGNDTDSRVKEKFSFLLENSYYFNLAEGSAPQVRSKTKNPNETIRIKCL